MFLNDLDKYAKCPLHTKCYQLFIKMEAPQERGILGRKGVKDRESGSHLIFFLLRLVLMPMINVNGVKCCIKPADIEHVNITVLQCVHQRGGESEIISLACKSKHIVMVLFIIKHVFKHYPECLAFLSSSHNASPLISTTRIYIHPSILFLQACYIFF